MDIPGYTIEKTIGEGGMARVYLALHKALNRKVAIKVMDREQGADPEFSKRFLREARIVANLTHPNIVTIHDVGLHDGHNYLVMELLPSGETLKDRIKAGVDSRYALSIVKQVATALKAAHEKNIVHRDIKPENIMFREDGSVVLMDFGVARSVDSKATQVTQAGLIIGTPQYISPEQAQGKNVGTYSDIYSLGVVFYEMLTGKAPYTADTPLALALKHVTEPVPTLTGSAAVYQPLLDRMMAKKRDERYSSCDRIIADIDSIEAGKAPVHATETLSADAVTKARAAAENLTLVEDFPALDAEKPAAQPKEIKDTAASAEQAAAAFPKTEILGAAAGAAGGASAYQATEILSRPNVDASSKAARKNTGKANEPRLTLVEKTDTLPAGRPRASGAKLSAILGVTLALLLAGGAYLFVDVDMGKLKTLVGMDPGPVYARVGRMTSIPSGRRQPSFD